MSTEGWGTGHGQRGGGTNAIVFPPRYRLTEESGQRRRREGRGDIGQGGRAGEGGSGGGAWQGVGLNTIV